MVRHHLLFMFVRMDHLHHALLVFTRRRSFSMRMKQTTTNNKLAKADFFMSKLVWVLIPLLMLGIFKGTDGVNLMCSLLLLVLAIHN